MFLFAYKMIDKTNLERKNYRNRLVFMFIILKYPHKLELGNGYTMPMVFGVLDTNEFSIRPLFIKYIYRKWWSFIDYLLVIFEKNTKLSNRERCGNTAS